MAYIAYYLHWAHAEIMDMNHRERRAWVDQVAHINDRLNDEDAHGQRRDG